jgi:hypothetical protein
VVLKENEIDRQQSDPLAQYEIRLRGALPPDWSRWFEGMTMSYDNEGNTLLSGLIVDQAALHGLLDKARDLGLALLEVRRVPRTSGSPRVGLVCKPEADTPGRR